MEGMMLSFPRPKPASWMGLAAQPPPPRRDASPISIVAGEEHRHRHSSACRRSSDVVPSIWHAITPSSGCAAASRASPRRLQRGLSAEEGSWNAAWDARPARWLHGSDSAWLLFGVCSCFSPMDQYFVGNQAVVEQGAGVQCDATGNGEAVKSYKLIGMSADGRCLFRAVAYGACLVSGKEAPDESQQKELADDLRAHVVDELSKRRNEIERFIEEDFDMYIAHIRQPHVWGGEPELLMASHFLQTPISVFMMNTRSSQLVNIANYGEEYKKNNDASIKVLFHGYGHYDALEILAEVK